MPSDLLQVERDADAGRPVGLVLEVHDLLGEFGVLGERSEQALEDRLDALRPSAVAAQGGERADV